MQPARLLTLIFVLSLGPTVRAAEPKSGEDLGKLPANEWVLLDREDSAGGKQFARAIYADNVDRLYLWGTGGKMPARNVYLRYELEALNPKSPGWQPAFPAARKNEWTAEKYPPFRIYGQSGPDGLKFDEGPRLQVVSGYHATNRVRWWDFDGVKRPSPIHTFNMACWDSKRGRLLYFSDGCTFALDPRNNTWTDLKPGNHPTTCRSVAWASLCYDAGRDRVLLFGGGLATNPTGAAPTWIYDCAKNTWQRPDLKSEPPPRCNAPIIYEPQTQTLVLFGGYNQSAALNDTWVYAARADRWEERKPTVAPPPMYEVAAACLPEGKVLVCGADARKIRRNNQAASSALKETWVYDVATNTWTPISAGLNLPGYTWLTADVARKHGVALLVAFGPERRTYALRYETSAAAAKLPGAAPGTIAWKYPEQKESLEQAAAPDRAAQAKKLAGLPVNQFVDAEPPGFLISKTWSTAVLDTDRSEVLYLGGGHSGYSGNDIARYSLEDNRWSLDFPPRFPPYLEGTNAGIYGWSYGMMPFSQHTYLWYCYDPASKTMVYLARPAIPDGTEVQVTDDPKSLFIFDEKKHGQASWVYDPAKKKMLPPSFGRSFANPWHLSLMGTPQGVFAMCEGELHRARVERDSGQVAWQLVDGDFPKPRQAIKYHYEFQPLVHDTKRARLVLLKGDRQRVDVFAREMKEGSKWSQLETKGAAPIGREAVYLPKHDTILWLGDKLCAFDCATNRMAELDVELPKGSYNHECAMVYDPKHDVCIALIPKSFTGPMQTFLFRFDPKSARYR
ncbi:MAG: Kelch repeat-containing protein [Gemmataceae bacterium]